MQSEVEIRGLECGYGRPVVRGVNLDVRGGEVVALLGPNGAGKSTLIKCILRLARIFKGYVRISGKSVIHMTRRELARLVSYVPQNYGFAYPMRVLDVVLLGRLPYMGLAASEHDVKVAMDSLERLGIAHLAHRDVRELSGGQFQMVHIARALAQGGRVLLLDEPTSNLDLKHQVEVMEAVSSLAHDQGLAVLMATHDINLALKYADRVAFMNDGKLILDAKPSDLPPVVIGEVVGKVYGVRVTVISNNGRPGVFL